MAGKQTSSRIHGAMKHLSGKKYASRARCAKQLLGIMDWISDFDGGHKQEYRSKFDRHCIRNSKTKRPVSMLIMNAIIYI